MTTIKAGRVEFGGDESAVEHDPRWELAQRVVHSPVLSRATQLRAILLYIVRQVILRPDESVHEFEIAHKVLGRRNDFNPLDDSIVRVQVAQLRKRLDLYFSTDGKNEEMVIGIGLGSYEPIFSHRSRPDTSPKPAQETEIAHEEKPAASGERLAAGAIAAERQKGIFGGTVNVAWTVVLCLATLILGGVAGFQVHPAKSNDGEPARISNPILRQVFAPGAVVNVVIADTSLVFLQNTVYSDISVGDYLDPKYPDNILANTRDPVLRSTLKSLTQSRYTSLNDADVVGECFHWGSILGANTSVRYARYMHVRDFESGNFVIVGSRRGNPWTSLFEPNLNFVIEEDRVTHIFHFRNRHPNPGEPPTFELISQGGGSSAGYVDIAVLPNLAGTGSVLLLNGFSIETNEAAANLIFEKDLPPAVSRALGSLSSSSKAEIFLRVRNLDKANLGWEIVSIRTSAP